MRRKEKEITNYEEIAQVMRRALLCRIALADGEIPYIVPVNFVVAGEHLYFHSSMRGKKIDILRKNTNVCFEIDLDAEIIQGKSPCTWGMKYLSVIGTGHAFFIDGVDEKAKVLNLLMEKYAGKTDFVYGEEILQKTAIVGVTIETITGKKSHLP